MVAIVAAVVGVAVLLAVVGARMFKAAVMEQYLAVVDACGVSREEFDCELSARGSLEETAAHFGVDAEAVVRITVTNSRHRWLGFLS